MCVNMFVSLGQISWNGPELNVVFSWQGITNVHWMLLRHKSVLSVWLCDRSQPLHLQCKPVKFNLSLQLLEVVGCKLALG
jgi:hypothetical protein